MFKLEEEPISIGDVYYHKRKTMYSDSQDIATDLIRRRKLRVDALYTAKGVNGKPDKTLVATTDLNTNQPYQPLLQKNFRKTYSQLNLTAGESFLYSGQTNRLGGFMTALYSAMTKADNRNLDRLEKAYPEYVKTYRSRWSFDDIRDKVEKGAKLHHH